MKRHAIIYAGLIGWAWWKHQDPEWRRALIALARHHPVMWNVVTDGKRLVVKGNGARIAYCTFLNLPYAASAVEASIQKEV